MAIHHVANMTQGRGGAQPGREPQATHQPNEQKQGFYADRNVTSAGVLIQWLGAVKQNSSSVVTGLLVFQLETF